MGGHPVWVRLIKEFFELVALIAKACVMPGLIQVVLERSPAQEHIDVHGQYRVC